MKPSKIIFLTCSLSHLFTFSFAGNPDRAGEAGATELLINPWAANTGMAGANTASVRGVEAGFLNIAGTAFTTNAEFAFSTTAWLGKEAGINLNTFGFNKKVGEAGVLGIDIMAISFGDIQTTTPSASEGGVGIYSPSFINGGISYAKVFSNSIYAGIHAKMIYEAIANAKTQGFAFDAGIQYVTGIGVDQEGKKLKDNLKFGISLKNIEAAPMQFSGDGLSFKTVMPNSPYPNTTLTAEQRAESFDIPSLLNVGAAYDYRVDIHRLTAALNFTSNTFNSDSWQGGMEYAFKELFMLRAGMYYEQGIFAAGTKVTVLTGPAAGFSLVIPLGKESSKRFILDYSYRATNPFTGIHSVGARITL